MSLKVEDKLEISELLSRYNLSMDRNDVEGWLNTWLDDGAFIANFGEARGKKELEELMKRILSEFVSGKRHVTTNLIVGREEKKGVGVISYLTVSTQKENRVLLHRDCIKISYKKMTRIIGNFYTGDWKWILLIMNHKQQQVRATDNFYLSNFIVPQNSINNTN
jgi:SnoaL-like domain